MSVVSTLLLWLNYVSEFCRLLGKCLQSREKFFSSFGRLWSTFRLRGSVVWLRGCTSTSPQSLLVDCLHLIHAFTGCASHLIHLYLSWEVASTSSPKNMLAAALGHGNKLVAICILGGYKGGILTAHKKNLHSGCTEYRYFHGFIFPVDYFVRWCLVVFFFAWRFAMSLLFLSTVYIGGV